MKPKLALEPSAAASIVIEPLAAITNLRVTRWEATRKVSEGTGKCGEIRTRLAPM